MSCFRLSVISKLVADEAIVGDICIGDATIVVIVGVPKSVIDSANNTANVNNLFRVIHSKNIILSLPLPFN
jgi:hypothetical protein